jgi:type IV secretion system protein VirB9
MKRALVIAALLAISAPALADDPRMIRHQYTAGEVVRIEGRSNVQATIQFGEDELIENVAIGDSESWQVTPNKRANLLFIKPLGERAATNMTVVTDKHVYLFDLVASPANRAPTYMLSFTYPKQAQPVRQADASAMRPVAHPNGVEAAAAADPYAIIDPTQLNFAWVPSGDKNLLPTQVYDNGEATFLAWRDGTAVPAILVKNEEGAEGPINFAVRGNVIVIQGVPRQLILRSGHDMAKLDNKAPARVRAALAKLDEVK